MAALLSFAPYNPASETWDSYLARFDCFLEANDFVEITDNRKRALFLNFCGPEIFEIARALLAPLAIQSAPWDVLQSKLRTHYAPKPSRIARRHAFHHRNQSEGETINEYVAALRKAALYCEFRDLDDALLDRVVCGVKDIKLQRRLLAKTDLTLQMALDEAQAAEMSDQSAAEIKKSNSPPASRKPVAVHHGDVSPRESADEDDDVYRLNASKGRYVATEKRQPACAGCGGNHPRMACKFKNAICRKCEKKGHLAKVCRSNQPTATTASPETCHKRMQKRKESHREDCFTVSRGICKAEAVIGQANLSSCKKIHVTVLIEGSPCHMEVDTGSSMTIISWTTLKRLVPKISKRQLDFHHIHLRDYQGNSIPVVGAGTFRISFKDFSGPLRLLVVDGSLPSLLGLDWFSSLGMGITGINSISDLDIEALTSDFADVFDGNLGRYTGTPISFNLDPQVAPIRMKPRRVPFALRSRVDEQLDKLISQGILEPVDHAKWETPIVTPVKPDGSVRICADYKCTLNKALQQNAYPVPVVQHLLHSLGEGKVFAKLDLAQAYQQLPVDDATAEAQTIVTHRGAFRCRRLQFGVSVAPGLFQSLMERLLQGISGVVPYFDDVLVSAANNDELLDRLRVVLTRFQEVGLKVKKEKCKIAVPQVEFLGYLIDASGLHPTQAKVQAIQEAPTPKNKTELQAFLGLLNFYSVFLPHKASVAEPLHRLLDKKRSWCWGRKEAAAFSAVKELLSSNSVLVQYNENLPLVLTCDASPFGVGAVLSHQFPDGREAPIAFFSRTLSSAERNYSQLDKEALASVAGVKRFHEYLYGKPFDLVTDHKPLLGLLAGDRQTPQVLSPRMLRWTVFLAAYSYRLLHRAGKTISHADALSRCPLPTVVEDPAPASSILLIEDLPSGPLTASEVAAHSTKDHVIAQVLNWVWRGWPKGPVSTEFLPFFTRHHELSAQRGCLLWGSRVVVPQKLRRSVLEALHVGHPGIVRMKALARSYVWWPNLDKAIADWVASCQLCQESRPAPPSAPAREWEAPKTPWSRVHIDFAGPFHGQTFMVVVDAYSKWLEVVLMTSTTSEAVIKALKRLFATHGLPDVIVSDNGPQLTSSQFELFLAGHGIRHALIAPFHPASNGQAERMVRSAKEALVRMGPGDWQTRVSEYLLVQHVTPSCTTNRSPAELLMGRRLRTDLDRLHPDYSSEVPADSTSQLRSFSPGDLVYAHNYAGSPSWIPARVVDVTGPRSYRVALEDGRLWRRHIDQLRGRLGTSVRRQPEWTPPETTLTKDMPTQPPQTVPAWDCGESQMPTDPVPFVLEAPETEPLQATPEAVATTPPSQGSGATGLEMEPRRSGRTHRRPTYLKDYIE